MKIQKKATAGGTVLVSGDDAEREFEERVAQRAAAAEERMKNMMPRFWLEVGGSAKLLFVSAKPVLVNEHNVKIDGYWNNYFLCRKTLDQCPLCDAGYRDYDALLYTVVNMTGYVSKTGKRMKNLKQVLALKTTAAAKFKRKKKDLETVKFALFEFARDSKDDPSTGGDISFIKQYELKELVAYFRKEGLKDEEIRELLTPYNFEERYKLKSIEELEAVVGTRTIGRSADDDLSLLDSDSDAALGEEQKAERQKKDKGKAKNAKGGDDEESSDVAEEEDDTSLLDELRGDE